MVGRVLRGHDFIAGLSFSEDPVDLLLDGHGFSFYFITFFCLIKYMNVREIDRFRWKIRRMNRICRKANALGQRLLKGSTVIFL